MKKVIKMESIEQFRHIVQKVNFLYPNNPPKVTFIGYEKIHGAQMGVSFNNIDGFWVQSKNNIITPEQDHMGCVKEAYKNKEVWLDIITQLSVENNIDLNLYTITVYAEWAGGNIQRNSAISGLNKRAIIFRYAKVSVIDTESVLEDYYIETKSNNHTVKNVEHNIFNIADFPTIIYDVDFKDPTKASVELSKVIEENEDNSPVGKLMGKPNNILEGYVFYGNFDHHTLVFKMKGSKHSKSKVKSVKKYTEEDLKKLDEKKKCATEIFSEQRCNQALTEIFGIDFENTIDIKKMGEYLKWVNADTIKEEYDILKKYDLTFREVNRDFQNLTKEYFLNIYNNIGSNK